MLNAEETVALWYDEYGEAIFTYILLMVRDYQQAEDLTQEIFVKAYRKGETFLGQSSLKTWLFSIAQHTTIDHIRKKNPLRHYLGLTQNERDSAPLPHQLLLLNEQQSALATAIQNLKPSYRQVVILRKLKEFSTKETADVLSWSESKVKSTLQRALQQLKTMLIEGGFDYDTNIQ